MLRTEDSLNILNWRINMNYIDFMKSGGIHIKEKNKGKFTKSAKRAGKSVQEHATDVLNDPNATRLQKRRAQFAKNAKKFHHEDGGVLFAQTGASVGSNYVKARQETTPEKLIWEDPEGGKKKTDKKENTIVAETDPTAWIDDYIQTKYNSGESSTSSTSTSAATSTSLNTDPNDKRGIRNNNWLNMRRSDNPWQGKISFDNSTDNEFEQFETPELGIRAATINLRSYYDRGIKTIRDIVSTWAPPSENNTSSYITNVAQRMGISPDAEVNVKDDATVERLIAAMAKSEIGRDVDLSVIRDGIAMA